MFGKAIVLVGATLVSALSALPRASGDPAGPTVSTPEECAVYAAALAPGSSDEGLFTKMGEGKSAYDISCDWAALGITSPKLIGLPSAECIAATARHQKDVYAVCGLAGWTVVLSRPTFSEDGGHASLSLSSIFHTSERVVGGRVNFCDLVKTAGKWRVTKCTPMLES